MPIYRCVATVLRALDKGCSTLFQHSCVVSGGDTAAASSSLCARNTTVAEMNKFLSSGDMTSPSSAFGFTFKEISEVLNQMGMTKEAGMLEKAVEFHGCQSPGLVWSINESGDYGCACNLKCENGGKLDAKSCSCNCRGDEFHGWHGATCGEAYGQCQMGLDSGNEGAARKCAVDGTCKSNFWGAVCGNTEVCCLTDFHGACCPFGSQCDCGTSSCSCLVPPLGCARPDTWKDGSKPPEESCDAWWNNCKWGACKDWNKSCSDGSWGSRECAGTCCKHQPGYDINSTIGSGRHDIFTMVV